MYLRYYDDRFGDLYEIYLNDVTNEFEGALRSIESIGSDPIHYDRVVDIPPIQRNAIEHMIHEALEKKKKNPSK